jgi:glutamyl-tRNA reductase
MEDLNRVFLLSFRFSRFPMEVREQLITKLQDHPITRNRVMLSTCYRLEIYGTGEPPLSWFHPHLPETWTDPVDVFTHLVRVAAGMDSPAIGEPQIFHQVKRAYLARRPHLTPGLDRLFQEAFRVAKRIRTETGIQQGHHSVITLTLSYLRRQPRGIVAPVLVVGTGEMAQLALKTFTQQGIPVAGVVSRTPERARRIGQAWDLPGMALWGSTYQQLLQNVPAVWLLTSAPHPILRRADLEGRTHPLHVVDLTLPSVLDPALRDDPRILRTTLDDVQQEQHIMQQRKQKALAHAEQILAQERETFRRWLATLQRRPVLRDLQQKARELEQAALRDFRHRFPQIPEEEVQAWIRRWMNKALHPARALALEADPEEVVRTWRISS